MSGTKKVLLIILAVFVGIPATLMLIAFVIGFVVTLADPDTYKSEVTTQPVAQTQQVVPPEIVQEEPQTTEYKDTIGAEFLNIAIDECALSADRSTCQCMFRELDQELSNTELLKLADLSITDPDAAASEMITYAVRCL